MAEPRPQSATKEVELAPEVESQPSSGYRGEKEIAVAEDGYPTDRKSSGPSSVVGDVAESGQRSRRATILRILWPVFHLVTFMLFTGWWIAGLILHRYDLGWLIPFLLWLAITFRLLTLYVPTKYMTKPIVIIFNAVIRGPASNIPEKWRLPLGAAGAWAVIAVATFATPDSAGNSRTDRVVSFFGLHIFLFIFYITSANRSIINWQAVIVGMLAQFILGLFVLRTKAGTDIFSFIAFLAKSLLGYSKNGTSFLTDADTADLPWFFISVVPPIIFFVAFIALISYYGFLQWAVRKFAAVFFHTMKISGAEAVVAAASPFIGQGESVMFIRPYIPYLTRAEIHQVMTSGFATIAGSVLYVYLSMGISPSAIISSCVMSIPGSIAISKMRYPETEETLTSKSVSIPEDDSDDRPKNGLDAFAKGSWLGLKIAGMVCAGVLCILSLLGLVDGLLEWWGKYLNINDPVLSVELVSGYIFYPVSFLLGVPRNEELLKVAQLIGIKVIANEFVAYDALTSDPQYTDLSPRARIIATYALCGFGNISSLGIQIGVLSQLAPGRSGDVSRLAVSALMAGVMATLTSASIAGMLAVDSVV
ncbi:hypothetical protein GQ53DRAFT_749374 [Thozetella sp. PMI_491]|nr:hypothetical protein GQ53DRAFT_749374 [Thozetella sp. PMI_491]